MRLREGARFSRGHTAVLSLNLTGGTASLPPSLPASGVFAARLGGWRRNDLGQRFSTRGDFAPWDSWHGPHCGGLCYWHPVGRCSQPYSAAGTSRQQGVSSAKPGAPCSRCSLWRPGRSRFKPQAAQGTSSTVGSAGRTPGVLSPRYFSPRRFRGPAWALMGTRLEISRPPAGWRPPTSLADLGWNCRKSNICSGLRVGPGLKAVGAGSGHVGAAAKIRRPGIVD